MDLVAIYFKVTLVFGQPNWVTDKPSLFDNLQLPDICEFQKTQLIKPVQFIVKFCFFAKLLPIKYVQCKPNTSSINIYSHN